jgi:hypothetical protein
VRYKQISLSLFTSPSQNINSSSSSFKAYAHGVTIKSNDKGKLFTFPDESPFVRLYLDVVRDTVCGLTLRTREHAAASMTVVKIVPLEIPKRIGGEDWPLIGITMIGQKRLVNIEWALRFVIANNIPGDFIECGVWRGGGSIFARAVLKALNIKDRHVWAVDSFEGLPKARTTNDNDEWSKQTYLRVLIHFLNKSKNRLLFI